MRKKICIIAKIIVTLHPNYTYKQDAIGEVLYRRNAVL